jgi:uncharacterized protein with FMN-binding domain
MKKSKISIIQVSRLIIQILCFVFLPALYINTFSGIKQIYLAIINQNFDFAQLIPQLIEVIVIVPFTIIMGRFFCGWMCAFGAFGDFIYKIAQKVLKIKFRLDEEVDDALKYVKYGLLAILIFIICTFNITTFSSFNPWDAFGMLATVGQAPAFSYVATNLTVGFILFALITIGSMFIERFFCRYLCPLGAFFSITSKLRIAKIRKTRTKCGNCKICTNNCAMGIPLYQTDVVKSGECINCMQCITACPRKNATLTISGDDVRPLVAGAAAVTVMTGFYYAGNITVSAAGLNSTQIESQFSLNSQGTMFKDGTYEGSGIGFRNRTTTVSVVVTNGKISDITSVSYGDDRKFYDRAFNTVTQEIISSQATEVDAVSGATFSSNGIMAAVEDALSNAKITSGMDNAISNSGTTDSQAVSSNQTQKENTETSKSLDSQQTESSVKSAQQAVNSGVQTENSESTKSTASQGSATSSNNTQQSSGSQASKSTTNQPATSSSTGVKDGTYEGSGIGFRNRTTTVSVVIQNGKVTDIETMSYGDDRKFFVRAFNTVTAEIINEQSTNVDAVSGATYSSRGIMEAVKDALSKAGNLS